MTLGIVFLFYLASIANGLKFVFGAAGILLLVFAFVSIPFSYDFKDTEIIKGINPIKLFKKLLSFAIASIVLCALTPNERQVYYMSAAYIGGSTIENIANSPEMSKLRIIVNTKMDEYIKENNIQTENKNN